MEEKKTRADLKAIATYQRVILVCIAAYLLALVLQFALPQEIRFFLALGFFGLAIVATVFVFMLATKVYSTGIGVLMGILTLIPCIGLIVLLIINIKATAVLKEHGIRVGLLGADVQ